MTDAAPARAVIADDERLMREQLRARLAEVWPELQIVAEARNGIEAVELVEQHRPDLVFLDIRMPGLTGVDAARQIAQMAVGDDESLPEIVFITAYDQYAVEAFEQGVADYVLKPAERDRACRSRSTASEARPPGAPRHRRRRQRAAGAATAAQAGRAAQPGRRAALPGVDPGHGRPEHPDDPGGRGAVLHQRREVHPGADATIEALIRKPIKELVDELDPLVFWQIHRSTLVNVKAIAGVTRDFRGRQIVGVKGHPEKLEVSRSYTPLRRPVQAVGRACEHRRRTAPCARPGAGRA
jgi:DNA-binding LytR/AlgR family response regulator